MGGSRVIRTGDSSARANRLRRAAPVAVLLLAAGLRFGALAHDARFHPDEALFATFARSAAVQGDWLLRGALDKTPLAIYAAAFSMTLAGVSSLPDGVLALDPLAGEFAARLPGVFASILLTAAVYALAKKLYRCDAALAAMLLAALSPFALAFSATAFTDMPMLLCITLALVCAAGGRWFWAGVWVALGFGCKQQALLVLPLVALVGWAKCRPARTGKALLHFLLPLAAGTALLAAWDAARGQPASLWALAAANNDPGRLIRADELLPRLRIWAAYAGWFAGPAWLSASLAVLAAAALAVRIQRQGRRQAVLTDALLAAYCAGYLLLHWLVAFNTYDRYLLPALTPALLLLARGAVWLRRASRLPVWAVYGLLALALLPVALDARAGRLPLGGDQGRHAGIDALADYLNARPLGTIIYDHWLGWELGYYMGAWSDKRRVYYPTPRALADAARRQADPAPRYLPVPAGQPAAPWLDALREAGFTPERVYDDGRFVVYRLTRSLAAAGASAAESSWPGQKSRFAD